MTKVILLSIVLYSFCFAQQQPFGSRISGGSDIISDAILIQNGFVLDSAVVNNYKYQFEYYGDGKLKSDICPKGFRVQEIVNGRLIIKWLPSRNDYFYNEKGKVDSVEYDLWKDTAWVNDYIIHYSYDNDENLLSKVYSDSGKIWRTDINKYDSSGNPILSEQVIVWLNDTTLTTREYDSQNRLTKVVTRIGPYPSYSFDQRFYQYDSSGNINCIVPSIYYITQSPEIDTVNQYLDYYFEFDNSGKLQTETLYSFYDLDTTKVVVYSTSYIYDNYDKIQEMYNKQFFYYDANGNLDTLLMVGSIGYFADKATLIDSYGNKIDFSKSSGSTFGRYNFFYYSKQVTGVEKSQYIGKTFKLSQNYPNPFNPSTIIKYTIPKETFVTLTVYDILGRKIKTLVSGEKSAGSYSVEFNAEKYSSGVYIYVMHAGNYISTKKLMLIK
jgi:hypothetical protein